MSRTSKDWAIREATKDDFPRIRELYSSVKGRARPEAYDWWRLYDNPFGQNPTVIAVNPHEECVGLYTLWPVELSLNGTLVRGAQSMDTMTHKAYQGQGIFVALARTSMELAEKQGIEVLYGFPNESSFPGFVSRLNWDHTGGVPIFWKAMRPSAKHGVRHPLSTLQSLAWRIRTRRWGALRVEVAEGLAPAARLGGLLDDRSEGQRQCRIRRSKTWLDWRYQAASGLSYSWVLLSDASGEVRGAALTGRHRASQDVPASQSLQVEELMCSEERVLPEVVAAVEQLARRLGVTHVRYMTSSSRHAEVLAKAGYRPHPPWPLIVRSLTTRLLPANVHDHRAWALFGGDCDVN